MKEKTTRLRFIFCLCLSSLYLLATAQAPAIDDQIRQAIAQSDSLKGIKKYSAAIEVLTQMTQHTAYAEAAHPSKADLYHKIAANYIKKGNYEIAAAYADTAIQWRQRDPDFDYKALAHSHFIKGYSRAKLNLPERALPDFLKAIDYAEKHPDGLHSDGRLKKRYTQYLAFTAESYREKEDYGRAEQYYEAALTKTQEVYGYLSGATAKLHSSIGHFHLTSNDTASVFANYDQALHIFSQLGEKRNFKYILKIKNDIAGAHVYFQNFQAAQQTFETVLQLLEDNRAVYTEELEFLEKKRKGLSNLGFTERSLGNFSKARAYYQEALTLAQQLNASGYGIELSRAYEGLGDVALAEQEWTKALAQYQKATQALSIDFAPTDPLALPSLEQNIIIDKTSLKRILALKAETLYRAYQQTQDATYLQAAFQSYQTLDALVAEIRQSFDSDVSQYDIVQGTIPIYEKATSVALQLAKGPQEAQYLEAAFNFASKNKAIVLLEGVQDEKALFAGIPKDLLSQEQALKKEFYDLEVEIFRLENAPEKDKALIDEVKQAHFEVSRTYEKFIAQLEENYPAYYQLKYSLTQHPSIEQLQRQLPDQSALVEFFVGLDSLYVFTLSTTGLQVYVQNKPSDFDQQCQAYRQWLTGQQTFDPSAFGEMAHRLYQLLLEEALQGLAPLDIDRLFIIPDDLLVDISFDALLTSPLAADAGQNLTTLPYLIREYALSYVYSNRLLLHGDFSKRQKSAAKSLFAGFALQYDDYTLAGIENADFPRSIAGQRNLGVLKYAVDEVATIADILGGQTWMDQAATKQTFVNEAPDYRILHMAMHGIVNQKFPLNSALVFHRSPGHQEHLLTAADLYSLSLNADMAVLSACDTGTGQLQKGEGAMTLARAFNYAGCPSLVASLWSAADISTKDLMIDFYHQLQQGEAKDVALQKAKLQYLEKAPPSFTNPFYWTHLAQIGNPSPLDLSSPGFLDTWGFYLAGGSLGLLGLLFWRRRQKNSA